jgi:hypothetical protein
MMLKRGLDSGSTLKQSGEEKVMSKNRHAYISVSLVTIFAVTGAVAGGNTSTTKPAIADYTRSLSFEPNRGQTDKQVDFLAHGSGYRLFLSHAEAAMALDRGVTVRMRPVGADPSTSAHAIDRQASKSNYFIGNVPEKWHTDVPNYTKVRYSAVYPGVDLVYYGTQRQLEYDFVLSPGADPGRISLEFQGPTQTTLDSEGDLVMHTAAGDLRWHKPIAYQNVNGNRKVVACDYAHTAPNRLGFGLAAYDRTKPLIIDPVLVYSTYLGGSGNLNAFGLNFGDKGLGVAVDLRGNAYVTGSTVSSDFPTKNAFQNNNAGNQGNSNAFVTKFDAAGRLVYSTYLGGSGFLGPDESFVGDQGNGIAVDRHGNAYVTGSTGSLDFPLKNAFQKSGGTTVSCIPCSTGFVTKLDPAGSQLVFSKYLGGSGNGASDGDAGYGIAVDIHQNVYVTGVTASSDFPTENAFQSTNRGAPQFANAFATKFNATGTALIYSTYLGGSGGSGLDRGNGIAVDAQGNAYVIGTAHSSDFPTANAFQDQLKGSFGNAFLTKFNAAGSGLVYSTYLGGSGNGQGYGDTGSGIAVDRHGSAYVTGQTTSIDFPTQNAFQKKLNSPNGNAFVTKFGPAGTAPVYSTYLGGSSTQFGDWGLSVAVNAVGEAFVTGVTRSTDFPTKDAFQPAYGGSGDAFVTKIDAAGCALVYSSFLGGSSLDGPGDAVNLAPCSNCIALDKHGNAYVVGTTSSSDFPTKSAFQEALGTLAGNAFVTKISAK